jgi:LysR family cys regulon transcriptional activator
VIARSDDPILKEKNVTLEKLSQRPMIAFDPAFGGRQDVNEAFSEAGLKPRVVLTAVDADVTKAYVERGMGIAILARVAFNPRIDKSLRVIDVDHLFKSIVLNVSLRKHAYLRSYVLAFISLFAPHLPRSLVVQASEGTDIDITRLNLQVPVAPM